MPRAVTAIYRTSATADLVRQDLQQLGIGRHNITIVPDTADVSYSTSAGANAGDAVDRLRDLQLPEDDARTYEQAVRNGDYVVSVEVDDDTNLDRVQEIMRRPEDAYGSGDLDRQGTIAGTGDMGAEGYRGGELNEDGTVKVVEEQLSVGKRVVERGAVRVHSYVREQPVEADVELRSTRVVVERRPVDRAVSPGDIAMQDQVLEARETAEEAVVAKQARVVEEIGLRTETEVEHETIRDTVRKTEVEIEDERTGERTGLAGDATRTDRDRF
jgi:uncharacterized protein (TIGR02271 family)